MKKEVIVSTVLTTVTPEGEDRITTEANGACRIGDSGILLCYAEPENGGTATWILTDDVVDLQRDGRTKSRFTFIRGRMTEAPYTTPHGNIALQVFTHDAGVCVDPTAVRFEARYTILSQGQAVADNTLVVEARFVPAQ